MHILFLNFSFAWTAAILIFLIEHWLYIQTLPIPIVNETVVDLDGVQRIHYHQDQYQQLRLVCLHLILIPMQVHNTMIKIPSVKNVLCLTGLQLNLGSSKCLFIYTSRFLGHLPLILLPQSTGCMHSAHNIPGATIVLMFLPSSLYNKHTYLLSYVVEGSGEEHWNILLSHLVE